MDVLTPRSIYLESISVPEIEMGFKKTVFNKKSLSGRIGWHVSGLLPGRISSYKSGYGYGVGSIFEMAHKKKELFLSCDLRSLPINEIKIKELSIIFGINFFGEDL